MTAERIVRGLLAVPVMVLAASCAFDAIHWLLHRCADSRSPVLRFIGSFHDVHHRFLDQELRFHEELSTQNIWKHHVPECVTQQLVVMLFYFVVDPLAVALTQVGLFISFCIVVALKGKDVNHRAFDVVPAPRGALIVTPPYHALHHRYPRSYMSSYVQLFDRLFGTGCPLRDRRFAITGGSGALGAPLQEMLKAAGAHAVTPLKFGVDWTYDDISRLDPILAEVDVLILAHGSKVEHAMAANCTSFINIIERFRSLTKDRRFPPEVWAVGSEIESHPAFGIKDLEIYLQSKRAYARHARRYYRDRDLIYRHIVPSAYTSPMGPGLMSGKTCARVALFFIRRGFRYVPVTYTGIALLNYVKFLCHWDLAPAPAPLRVPAVTARSADPSSPRSPLAQSARDTGGH